MIDNIECGKFPASDIIGGTWLSFKCADPIVGKTVRINSVSSLGMSICGIRVYGYSTEDYEIMSQVGVSIDNDTDGRFYMADRKGFVNL